MFQNKTQTLQNTFYMYLLALNERTRKISIKATDIHVLINDLHQLWNIVSLSLVTRNLKKIFRY